MRSFLQKYLHLRKTSFYCTFVMLRSCLSSFKLHFFFQLFLSCWAVALQAQEYRTEIYRVEQGLPTNLTKAILQDRLGFVWVSTDAGLIRLDGKHAVNFADKLPSNYVKHIIKRKGGNLLVANDKGISKVTNNIDTVLFEPLVKADIELSDTTIASPKFLLEDHKQRLWIGQDQNVSLLENGKLTNFRFGTEYQTTSWTRGFSVAQNERGHVFATSQRGTIFRFDEAQRQFVKLGHPNVFAVISACFPYTQDRLLIATENGLMEIQLDAKGYFVSWKTLLNLPNISFIAKDSKEKFLIGTWNAGLYTCNLFQKNQQLKKISKLPFKVINDIYIDNKDNAWISSDDGVAFLHNSFFVHAQIPTERNYLIAAQQGQDSSIYATEGAVIVKVKNDSTFTGSLVVEGAKYGLKDILSVAHNQHGLWYGTSNATVYKLQNNRIDTAVLSKSASKIIYLLSDKNHDIWACQHETKEIMRITPQMKVIKYGADKGIVSRVYAIAQDQDGKIYCSGNSQDALLYEYDEKQDRFINISTPITVTNKQNEFRIDDLAIDNQKQIWLGGTYGLFLYGKDSTRHVILPKNLEVTAVTTGNDGSLWLGTNEGLMKYYQNDLLHFDELNGLPSKTIAHRGVFIDYDSRIWIATAAGLAYSQGLQDQTEKTPTPVFLALQINGKRIDVQEDKNLTFQNNSYLQASFISLTFPSDKVLYQYRLVEKEQKTAWSEPVTKSELLLPQLHKGNYLLEIRALQQGAFLWSNPLRFQFNIEPAWYLRWWAFLLYAAGLGLVIYTIFNWYTQRLKKEKEALETLVQLRTQQIQEQKDDLDKQNQLLELQNINIVASIQYAKQIQDAMLPTAKRMDELFPNNFIFFRPKDIVSGDFYWCNETKFALSRKLAKQIVAAVDCTGHGVPGAFMSLIANSLLDEICVIKGVEHTDFILRELNKGIQKALKQQESENMDGLDLALCIIDKANQIIEFSGAKRPLFYVYQGEMHTIKGHHYSIGGYHVPLNTLYQRHTIPFEQEISLYLTSDGYQDQFGKQNKRLSSQNLRQQLLANHTKDMATQRQLLEQQYESWKGNNFQNDDVLVLGLRVVLEGFALPIV